MFMFANLNLINVHEVVLNIVIYSWYVNLVSFPDSTMQKQKEISKMHQFM